MKCQMKRLLAPLWLLATKFCCVSGWNLGSEGLSHHSSLVGRLQLRSGQHVHQVVTAAGGEMIASAAKRQTGVAAAGA